MTFSCLRSRTVGQGVSWTCEALYFEIVGFWECLEGIQGGARFPPPTVSKHSDAQAADMHDMSISSKL